MLYGFVRLWNLQLHALRSRRIVAIYQVVMCRRLRRIGTDGESLGFGSLAIGPHATWGTARIIPVFRKSGHGKSPGPGSGRHQAQRLAAVLTSGVFLVLKLDQV